MSKNKDFNVWMVRAGEGNVLIDEFLSKMVVAIGWEDLQEIKVGKNRDELDELVRKTYPNEGNRYIGQAVGQLWSIYNSISEGDKVITYDKKKKRYFLGEIDSEYQYDSSLTYPHTRRVKWNPFPIKRQLLTQDSKDFLSGKLTVYNVQRRAWNELEFLVSIEEGYKGVRVDRGVTFNGLLKETTFENFTIADLAIEYINFSRVKFVNVHFNRVKFVKCDFPNSVNQSTFVDCIFENCSAFDSLIEHVRFENCFLKGFVFHNSRITQTVFDEGRFSHTEIDESELIGVHFASLENSDTNQIDKSKFLRCVFYDSEFINSNWDKVSFIKTAFDNSKFRDCHFNEIMDDFATVGIPIFCDFYNSTIPSNFLSENFIRWNNVENQSWKSFLKELLEYNLERNDISFLDHFQKNINLLYQEDKNILYEFRPQIFNKFNELFNKVTVEQNYMEAASILENWHHLPKLLKGQNRLASGSPVVRAPQQNQYSLELVLDINILTSENLYQVSKILYELEKANPLNNRSHVIRSIKQGSLIIDIIYNNPVEVTLMFYFFARGLRNEIIGWVEGAIKVYELRGKKLDVRRKEMELEKLSKDLELTEEKKILDIEHLRRELSKDGVSKKELETKEPQVIIHKLQLIAPVKSLRISRSVKKRKKKK